MTATSNGKRALLWGIYVALALGAWACEEASRNDGTSTSGGTGGAPAAGTGGAPMLVGAGGAVGTGAPCVHTDEPPRFQSPPIPCPGNDASACDLPPSVCDGEEWLIYYQHPQCIDGFCRWDWSAHRCKLCDCVNGGCWMDLTTAAQ